MHQLQVVPKFANIYRTPAPPKPPKPPFVGFGGFGGASRAARNSLASPGCRGCTTSWVKVSRLSAFSHRPHLASLRIGLNNQVSHRIVAERLGPSVRPRHQPACARRGQPTSCRRRIEIGLTSRGHAPASEWAALFSADVAMPVQLALVWVTGKKQGLRPRSRPSVSA
jgi:hypothetical protein